MAWPPPFDFRDAVQNPENCFEAPDLAQGVAAVNRMGTPVVWSRNFACLFKVATSAGDVAVRCFTREVRTSGNATAISATSSGASGPSPSWGSSGLGAMDLSGISFSTSPLGRIRQQPGRLRVPPAAHQAMDIPVGGHEPQDVAIVQHVAEIPVLHPVVDFQEAEDQHEPADPQGHLGGAQQFLGVSLAEPPQELRKLSPLNGFHTHRRTLTGISDGRHRFAGNHVSRPSTLKPRALPTNAWAAAPG